MASPQPTDAHGILAHELQENIIVRDFTELRLKLIYLIIRLSWGCGQKAWQYSTYKDFEVIGLHKSDVAGHLRYLDTNRVVIWNAKYNLLIFNKDYDQWKIPINRKSSVEMMSKLIHKSLKNTNDVRSLLTVLVKIPNEVSKNPEQLNAGELDKKGVCGQSKKSIKESNIYTTDFEKFYEEYPRPEDKKRTYNNWKSCLKSFTVLQLMNACLNYKKAKVGTDRQYIKSSANFLGREKPFEDYINKISDKSMDNVAASGMKTNAISERPYTPEELEIIKAIERSEGHF